MRLHRRVRLHAFIVAGCLFAVSAPAGAQIVNSLPDTVAPGREGWSGELTGALRLQSGNNDLEDIGGSGVVHFRSGIPCRWCLGRGITTHHVFLRAGGRWMEQGDHVVTASTLAHLRYQYTPWVRVGLEGFTQYEHDQFRRIVGRALGGVGLRGYAFTTTRVDGLLGSAYLLERGVLSNLAGAPDAGAATWTQRSSNYALVSVRIAPAATFVVTGFVQPAIRDVEDARFLGDATLIIRASPWLMLRPSCSAAYDTRPPFGVERLDRGFQTTIGLTLAMDIDPDDQDDDETREE